MTARNTPGPPKMYSLAEMPRVDVHVHIRARADGTRLLRKMNAAGITLSINLSGNAEWIASADEIHRKWKGRILFAPGSYRHPGVVWWSKKDLITFRDAGAAGTKIHRRYHRGLSRKPILSKLQRQGELGLPVIGLHIADPPMPGHWEPNYWDCIRETESVIRQCPQTTFIMAHGFWLMCADRGLDVLSDYFDRYDNLNADLSATFQWWDPPMVTYDKLRDFVVRYQDRLLYGTDGNASYSRKRHFESSYRILETRDEHLPGFFTRRYETHIKGLGLSLDALNRIYYWNAARLIPRVRESLLSLGYQL